MQAPAGEPSTGGRIDPIDGVRRGHRWIGVLTLIAFLATGQVMHWRFDHLEGMADGPRLLHRTCHIYLLWCGLLHLTLGLALPVAPGAGSRRMQWLALALLALVPIGLLVSFFAESFRDDVVRPLAAVSIYLAVAGTLLHAWGARRVRSGAVSGPAEGS